MKKLLLVAVVLAGGIAVYYYWGSLRQKIPVSVVNVFSATNASNSTVQAVESNRGPLAVPALPLNGLVTTDTNATPSAPTNTSNVAAPAVMVPADTNMPTNLPQMTILENVRRAVRQYGQMFGGDPVGTNPEITAALTGKNPKGINFLSGLPGTHINDQGEMVDAWGTPYFFHQLSGSEMEIHSAGPDKVMWTSDDLVAK